MKTTRRDHCEIIDQFSLKEIDKARAEVARLTDEDWDAFMKRCGSIIFVCINPPQSEPLYGCDEPTEAEIRADAALLAAL